MSDIKTLAALLQPVARQHPVTLWGPGGGILYFMRSADCPLCGLHVRKLVARADAFHDAGVVAGVVVPDSAEAAVVVKDTFAVPFAVYFGNGAHAEVGLHRVLFDGLQQSGTLVVNGVGDVVRRRFATLPFTAFDEADLELLLPRRAA